MKGNILAGIIIVVVFGFLIWVVVQFIDHPCIQSHQQKVHNAAYMDWGSRYIGRRWVKYPVYHPSTDTIQTICDKYK